MKYLTENLGLKVLVSILFAVYSMGIPSNLFAEGPSSSYVQNNVNGSQTLTGHVPSDVAKASFKYHAHFNLNAQIILPLSNQSQLSSLLKDLYDPKSPNFHQFFTPAQFVQQFAPSSIDVTQIQEYLKSEGIVVSGQSQNGAVLNVTGPSEAFEGAFGLHINHYQKSDGTMFFAPDADPKIPVNLAGKILAIGGLDNLPKYKAHVNQLTNALPKAAGTGPEGFLAPNDVLTAYNMNSISSNGSGQTIGLFELQGYSNNDILAYEAQFGLPNVSLQNVIVDGFSGVSYPDGADEVTLDIEIAAAMAPGSSITVFEAPNTTQSWIDEWTQIAENNTIKVISCSWGEPELDSPTLNFDNNIFQQMAAQGQAVFVAAGDNGAYDAGGSTLAVDEPSDQPYVTGVGISKLTTNSSGAYSSESASLYGGGGISAVWAIPAYQTIAASQAVAAAHVSTTMRNMPDVSFTADPATAYAFYINGGWGGWWGSSIASPIWASFISRVNQGLGAQAPIGSVNAALYQIAQTANYTNDFHSITTGNNGYYPAEPGFNDATGLGSFNGLNLYNDLVKNAVPPTPVGLNVSLVGTDQVGLTWGSSTGATSYNIKRSNVSGGPFTILGTSVNTTYTDLAIAPNETYYYVVSAVNATGESANSAQASISVVGPTSAPTDFNGTPGNGQVALEWLIQSGATYNVKRSTVSGGPYTTIANISVSAYTDTSVINGTTYYYVVSAVNSLGESPNSTQIGVTPVFPAPNGLNATAGSNQVVLQWTAIPGTTSYNVKRSTISGGPYTTIANTSVPTYSDTSVINGTTYYYVVSAVNSLGESPNSSQVGATPGSSASSAPNGLTATATGPNWVTLQWTSTPGAISYNVKRSTVSGGPYTTIVNTSLPPYTDTSVIGGTTYYYVVSAVNSSGESPNSLQVSVTLGSPAPNGLTATAGSNQVVLQWRPIIGTMSYNVKRSAVSGGPYTTIGTSSISIYSDEPPVSGVPYYYVVSAVNAGGESPNSSEVSAASIRMVPMYSVAENGCQISISGTTWSTNYGNNIQFVVTPPNAGYAVSLTDNGVLETLTNNTYFLNNIIVPHTIIACPTLNTTETITASAGTGGTISPSGNISVSYGAYQTFTVTPNTGYVASLTVDGTPVTLSNNIYTLDNVIAAHTVVASFSPQIPMPPPTPVGLNISLGNDQVGLTWSSSTGATSYNVKRSSNVSGGPYTTISNTVNTNYMDLSVSPNNTYYYVVSAINAAGESANSAQVSVIIGSPPVITSQPVSTTVLAPATATFSVVATGAPALFYYQWKQSTGHGAFFNISGATSSSYTTPATSSANNGTQYEVIVSNTSGSVTSNIVTLTVNSSQPVVVASPSTVNAGGAVTVTITNDPGNAADWVGLYPVGAPATGYVSWGFLSGTHAAPATGLSSATMTFIMPSTAGQYELRLNLNNTYTLLATSNAITVNAVTPTITASPGTVNAGGAVTVTVTNGPGNSGDWVGLYPVGAPANAWVSWQFLNGTHTMPATGISSATQTFTAPSTGGQYELRFCFNNTNTVLATSNAVTVTAVTPTITASPGTVSAGGTVSVTVSNGPGNTGDWVGLYPIGAPANAWVSWQFLNGTHTMPATGISSATQTFTAPSTGGQYELRFCFNNTNTVLATSNAVTVNAVTPTITASPSTVNAGGAVTVTVTNGPGNAGDWVGLFPVGAPANGWASWEFLNGTHAIPATGVSSATQTFTAPSTGGQYELRLYLNNTNTLLATSNAVTVSAVTPAITASPSTVNAGGAVTVSVTNGPGNAGDWVGLYPVGAPANAWVSWEFLNGTHTMPATGASSATLTFTAPTTGGQYELRFCFNNTNTVLATSNAVTVTAVTPTITASPGTVSVGGTVTVTITNGPGNAGDWVGLYPVGAPATGYLSWEFLNGAHSIPATGTSSAALTFTAPSTAGQYELRFYSNNTYTVLATSNTVTLS